MPNKALQQLSCFSWNWKLQMRIDLESLDPWMSLFPLESFEDWEWCRGTIVSPRDLALVEQIREGAALKHPLGRSVPTDIFLFGLGEPTQCDITKVGGLPYRPSNKPWPQTPAGKPYTFLAQFRFTESKDTVGTTPGDILLVFTLDHDMGWPGSDEYFEFEWYPLGIETLADPQNVPKPAWEFVVCHGIRYRTTDFTEDRSRKSIINFLRSHKIEDPEIYVSEFCQMSGMKIGGIPSLIPEGIGDVEIERDLPGTFLGSLSSIFVSPDVAYPWINHPKPIDQNESCQDSMTLNWRDGAVLNFSLDDEGKVHWVAQFW
jgi:hypothetical protein